MNQGTKAFLKIRYVNGTEQKFEFTVQAEALNIATRIKDALSANQLILELDDRVLILPFQNIQSIELTPRPDKLPPIALKGVRLIS
jgi:hypothetical protein